MNSWYEVKVRYTKQLESGVLKRVVEPYLVDATTFTEAEARIYEELGSLIRGEFMIMAITKKEYADIFSYDDSDVWYLCKTKFAMVDPDSGKSKVSTNQFLVSADSVKDADSRIKESLKDLIVDYELKAVTETPIVDIFPFTGERDLTPHMEPEQIQES